MEVVQTLIWIDQDSNKDFFIVKYKRINEDQDHFYDESGLLFYSARGENAVRYAYGGLSNDDLLSIGSLGRIRVALTSNQTLIVSSNQGARYFRIDHPRLFKNSASKEDLDKGLNITVYGVDKEPLDFDRATIHRLYKFSLLIIGIGVSILISVVVMAWALTRKKKVCLEDYEDYKTHENDDDDKHSNHEISALFSHKNEHSLQA